MTRHMRDQNVSIMGNSKKCEIYKFGNANGTQVSPKINSFESFAKIAAKARSHKILDSTDCIAVA